jgi:hypothetical protein
VTTPQREREILERSIHAIAQHARDAYALIEELHAAGFPPNGPAILQGLAERLQGVPMELRELVQGQHPVVHEDSEMFLGESLRADPEHGALKP